MTKKRALVTQVIMTFIMATTMSGIMGLIVVGPSMDWLRHWPTQFITAWPIAFALTMVAWPLSMKLAGAILSPRGAKAEAGVADADVVPVVADLVESAV